MRQALSISSLFILACGFLSILMYRWNIEGSSSVTLLTACYCLLVAIYLHAYHKLSDSDDLKVVYTIFAAALVARLLLAAAPIMLSNDIHRYLWEGELVRYNINPYQFAPDYPGLEWLRDYNWKFIDHKYLTAIYPPLTQLALGLFARTEIIWKLFLVACEAVSMSAIVQVLSALKVPRGRLVVYAFMPLSVIEVALSGHIEGLLVMFIVLFFLGVVGIDRDLGSRDSKYRIRDVMPLLLNAIFGFLVKYVSLLPLALFVFMKRRRVSPALFAFCAIVAVLVTLLVSYRFLDTELSIFSSLLHYLTHWRYNDSIFHLLGAVIGVDWQDSSSFTSLKLVLLCAWIALILSLLRARCDLLTITIYGFAGWLLFSPVFHPWYALWFAPLLCFKESKALFYLCLSLPLAYSGLVVGQSNPSNWIKLIEFVPVWVILAVELASKLGGQRKTSAD